MTVATLRLLVINYQRSYVHNIDLIVFQSTQIRGLMRRMCRACGCVNYIQYTIPPAIRPFGYQIALLMQVLSLSFQNCNTR